MKEITVDVQNNLTRLLKQEDTDKDLKITIEDTGPKRFLLTAKDKSQYQVCSSYYLSNLLQILAHANKMHKKEISIKPEQLFQNPVVHLNYQLEEYHWEALTRTLDEKGMLELLEDSKGPKSSHKRIYIPHTDEETLKYFEKVSKKHPFLNLELIKLPEKIDPEYVANLNNKPGILALAIDHENQKGIPFIVPGGRFNEMYGWDSYFIIQGLLQQDRMDLSKSILQNCLYQVRHYGQILNANRTYYLTRSHPPLLTSSVWSILSKIPEDEIDLSWLREIMEALLKEYYEVWMNSSRLCKNGLNRYFGQGTKEPPEVEEDHFKIIYTSFAKAAGMSLQKYREKYLQNEIEEPKLDEYFMHDRAMRESGHDTTNRLEKVAADLNTVDLNSLLYKFEVDISLLLNRFFEGNFQSEVYGLVDSKDFESHAQRRAEKMTELMWDEKKGMFFDYNFIKNEKTNYESVTNFFPLFAKLATNDQAKIMIDKALFLFEAPGGLVSTTLESRGKLSKKKMLRQWDYPFGWAPHQMIVWEGFINYGYKSIARRLAYRWLYLITREAVDYNGVIAEKYDVVDRTYKRYAEYGNVGSEFGLYPNGGFGWTNASFLVGISYLSENELQALKHLYPPEWVF